MKNTDKELTLRVLEIVKNAIVAAADEIRMSAETDLTGDGVAKIIPVQRRIAFYQAIEAAGPGGISQQELRKAALAAGYASLADTKVYYRKKGTAHLVKVAGYRTTLTDAGHVWLRKHTAGSAA